MTWAVFAVLTFVVIIGLVRLTDAKRAPETYAATAIVVAGLAALAALGVAS